MWSSHLHLRLQSKIFFLQVFQIKYCAHFSSLDEWYKTHSCHPSWFNHALIICGEDYDHFFKKNRYPFSVDYTLLLLHWEYESKILYQVHHRIEFQSKCAKRLWQSVNISNLLSGKDYRNFWIFTVYS
jgi:hypothetical protein